MKKFILLLLVLVYQAFPKDIHTPISVIDTIYDTIPVITLLGANPMNLDIGDTYSEPGATATDDIDGDLTDEIVITGTVNTSVAGTYTRTYTVTNSLGNQAVKTRWVHVLDSIIPDDTIPPVITILGANPMLLHVGDTYIEPGATAVDDVDGDLTSEIHIFSTVNTAEEGLDTVYYSVSDNAGNQAGKIRLVHITDSIQPPDTIPPVITLLGSNPLYLHVGDTYTEPGATAVDNVDGDITHKIQITGHVNTSVEGAYAIHYAVSDSAGNESSADRAVYVTDTTTIPDSVIYVDTASGIVMLFMVSNGTYENIVISTVDSLEPPDSQDIVKVYNFNVSFENQTTLHSAYIFFPYTDNDISGFDESTLTFRYYNEYTNSWEVIPSILDMNNNIISAKVSHFSIYGITGIKDVTSIETENRKYQTKLVQVNKHRIVFSLDRDSPANISLYSSSGRLIKTLFNGYAKRGENIITLQKGLKVSRGQYFIVLKFGTYKKVISYLTIE